MSRSGIATISQARIAGLPSLRIPYRIALDCLALVEIGLVVAAAALAKVFYIAFFLESGQRHQNYVLAGLAGGAVIAYLFRARGLYEPAALVRWRRRIGDLITSIGLGFLVLIAIAYLLKISADFSRGWLLSWFALVCLFLPLSRPFSARLLSWLAAEGYTARRIAVVANGPTGEAFAAKLRARAGIKVVGIFTADTTGGGGYPTVLDLIAMGQRNEVDEIIIAAANGSLAKAGRLLESLSVLPVDMWLHACDIDVPILGAARLGPVSLLQVKPKPIRDWGYVLKATFDYLVAAASMLVFAPLMLVIAAAIKLDSRGPVFFRQRRHGYNHRVIDVYKFRTMTVEENGERIEQARKDDPRVTRVGKFLRRTSLDELPQLLNVLKGEMSLVGPRPHALAHNRLYGEQLQRYANRHCVKPGITGWAQINGFRGPTEDPEKMRQRVQLDLHYIEHWSIWLDLKILILTPFLGFVHRNAL
jgi:putative colanic acid biosynthesis UDP-glucose lipid carrier transferase